MLASVAVAPSAGAYKEKSGSGTKGEYTVPDYNGQPGAICKFENNPGQKKDEINKITTRKTWAHGPYAKKSWVGQRIVVMKNPPPHGDQKFRAKWYSPIIKGKANQTSVMTFPQRNWKAPEKSKAQWRVHVVHFWYKKGTKNKVIGKTRGVYELYRHKVSGESPLDTGAEGGPAGKCSPKYPHGE
jgi:hypothetical protein